MMPPDMPLFDLTSDLSQEASLETYHLHQPHSTTSTLLQDFTLPVNSFQSHCRSSSSTSTLSSPQLLLPLASSHLPTSSNSIPALGPPALNPKPQYPHALNPKPYISRQQTPPRGCAPDAIKLFVGNIPKHYTEAMLLPFFETVGPVIELVILRDKVTQESKGGAFLWYIDLAHADLAMSRFNLSHVLSDPSGAMTRPLVVRPANLRPGAGMPPMNSHWQQQQVQQQVQEGGSWGMGQGYHSWQQQESVQPWQQQHQQQPRPWWQEQQQQHQQQQQQQQQQQHVLYPPSTPAALPAALQLPPNPLQQQAQQAPPAQPPTVTLSMQLSTQQLAFISEHLFTVQTMSATVMSSAPLTGNMASLLISGGEAQVEHAKQLILALIMHSYTP